MIRIDTAQLLRDLDTLATFTEPDTPGWTRRAFSPAFRAGRVWLAEQMRAAGLSVTVDAVGNLIGRRAGAEDLPPLMIGSHSDTVLGGGRFDGMLGVLAGIALAQSITDNKITLRHPLEIVDFLAEEPTPFGSCIGSRGLVGALDATALVRTDGAGRTLAEAITEVGGQPSQIANAARSAGSVAAYLELHIEQGRVLEVAGAPIGVVQGIVGIRRINMRFMGQPDHAGATPMCLRHDALAVAAEVILAAERAAHEAGNAVATVGTLHVAPNHSNVVPGTVTLSAEMRSLDWSTVERIWAAIERATENACAKRGVTYTVTDVEDTAPMRTPDWLFKLLQRAAPDAPVLPSGAGHDGSWVGQIAPIGMLFVRTLDGRSHCPEEHAAADDIAAGVNALARAVSEVDKTKN
jgi:N-carbamoyl-L-amino-acid hydrolase